MVCVCIHLSIRFEIYYVNSNNLLIIFENVASVLQSLYRYFIISLLISIKCLILRYFHCIGLVAKHAQYNIILNPNIRLRPKHSRLKPKQY